jgi:dihydroorotase
MHALLIRGGTLVTPHAVEPADVLIEDETVAAVGPALSAPPGARIVDARERLVFPGLIDPHVHLREPGGEHKEDFTTGTRAALAGGFTTVLAMPNTRPPITSHETLAQALALAASKAVCDFGLFVGATADNAEEAAGLENAVGLKLYMGSSTGSLLVPDLAGQLAHFERYPGVIALHAEDEEAVSHFAAQGRRRPPVCAVLATARALALAEHLRRHVHICHVSTAQEIALIRDAKTRGVPITCEVTPHHLFLTAADEHRLGPLGRMNPPLRSPEDSASLWANLDVVDCLATDHAPHTLAEKRGPPPPAGVPGLETALPLLLTAVSSSLCEVARLMAAGPARTFNLARKGHVAPGYDADLTLVDPGVEWTIGEHPLLTKCGWSPFKGRQVRGCVERVVLRGQEVFAHGEVLAQPGYGHAIRCLAPGDT